MRGEDQNTIKTGHHQPARETLLNSLACKRWPNIECWLGGCVNSYGIQTSIDRKHYIFVCVFQGGGGGLQAPCPPSGSAYEQDTLPSRFITGSTQKKVKVWLKKVAKKASRQIK